MTERSETAGFENGTRLDGIVDVRNHDPLGTAIQDAGGVVRVVRGNASDWGDAEAKCGDTDRGRCFQGSRVVLKVEIQRVEAAGGGHHRDVRGTGLVDAEAQDKLFGCKLLFGEVNADCCWHG